MATRVLDWIKFCAHFLKRTSQGTFLPSLVQIGPAVWEEEMFKEVVDDGKRTTDTRPHAYKEMLSIISCSAQNCTQCPEFCSWEFWTQTVLIKVVWERSQLSTGLANIFLNVSNRNSKQEGHDGPGSLTWVIFPTNEFYIFVPLVPTCDPRVGQVLIPRGIIWMKLTKVYKETLHTKNLSSIPSSFREEEFWSWSSLFLWYNLWPLCEVSFDSKGIIWIKLIKVHKEMLNTKYQSSNLCSFREEEFWSLFSFFLCSYVPTCDPQGGTSFDPTSITWTNLVQVDIEILNTKYQSSTPSISKEKNFEDGILCPYVPTCDPQGGANLDPRSII